MTTAITYSPEQQSIFNHVLTTKDNVAIRALAGTGKTFSLVELAKQLPSFGSKVFCAFNKDIVLELERKLAGTGVTAKTFHSIGLYELKKHLGTKTVTTDGSKYKTLAKAWVDGKAPVFQDVDDPTATDEAWSIRAASVQSAITNLVDDLIARGGHEADERGSLIKEVTKDTVSMMYGLLNMLRLNLVEWDDVEGLQRLIAKYGLAIDVYDDEALVELAIAAVPVLMLEGERLVKQRYLIDFTDMIYWCVRWDIRMYQYTYVFVDECQDLSRMQRAMIKKIIYTRGGRIVLVGDPNQAIYAFAGADSDSFDLSVNVFNAVEMPLTVTRRCAQVITHHATERVPEFHGLPEKPRGKVVWLDEERLATVAEPGDMVLSRIKSPLVAGCLSLIAAGKPATILGNDIGKAMIALLERLEQRAGFTFAKLTDFIDAYEAEMIKKATDKGDEGLAEHVKDQCEAIRVMIDKTEPRDMDGLKMEIENLFSDKRLGDVVVFATVHKSKGLEADRVFILAPERMPLVSILMSAEQMQQEYNLDYVARTRAKTTLVYLTNRRFIENHARPPYAQTTMDDVEWMDDNPFQPLSGAFREPTVITVTREPVPQLPAPLVVTPVQAMPKLADLLAQLPPNEDEDDDDLDLSALEVVIAKHSVPTAETVDLRAPDLLTGMSAAAAPLTEWNPPILCAELPPLLCAVNPGTPVPPRQRAATRRSVKRPLRRHPILKTVEITPIQPVANVEQMRAILAELATITTGTSPFVINDLRKRALEVLKS